MEVLEKTLDELVQTHQDKENLLEGVILAEMKQLNSLTNILNKRMEDYGEEDENSPSQDCISISAQSPKPLARSRVQSEPWSQKNKDAEEKNPFLYHQLEEEDCESNEFYKSASDIFEE